MDPPLWHFTRISVQLMLLLKCGFLQQRCCLFLPFCCKVLSTNCFFTTHGRIEALCSQVACGRFCLSVCLLIFLWVAAFTGALLSITCRIYWDVTFLSPLKILKFFLINLAGGLSVLCWSSLQTRCWLNWFSWMICFLLHLSPLTRTHCFSLLRGALLAEVVALRRICMHLIP